MDGVDDALRALRRESRECIARAQAAVTSALRCGAVPPRRVAVALAQPLSSAARRGGGNDVGRDDEESDARVYALLCLIDALLINSSGGSGGKAGGEEAAAVAAMLREWWPMALPLLAASLSPSSPLRAKALRLARRWRQRGLLDSVLADDVIARLDAPSSATRTATAATPLGRDGGGDDGRQAAAAAAGDDAGASASSSPLLATAQPLPAAERVEFAALVRGVAAMLAALPPSRALPFCELVARERHVAVTRAALDFLRGVYVDLRREDDGGGGGDEGGGGDGPAAAATAAGEDARNDEAAAAAAARATLGRLLGRLEGDGGGASVARARARQRRRLRDPSAGVGAAAARVLRYATPLYSDAAAQLTLLQRPHGADVLQRRRHRTAAAAARGRQGGDGAVSDYYPKSAATTARPFHAPAAASSARGVGGGGVQRRAFPGVEEWVEARDMATLALYELVGDDAEARKRARDDA